MRLRFFSSAAMVMVFLSWSSLLAQTAPPPEHPEPAPQTDTEQSESRGEQPAPAGEQPAKRHWRCDPAVLRHPGSYLGGSVGYLQAHAWVDETEDHAELNFGPLHNLQTNFRVGDAFTEWLAVGFQIAMSYSVQGEDAKETLGAFALFLDVTFYPFEGLGIRPSAGMGLAYAMGEKDFDFGTGGPASVAFALLYEIRLARLLVIAPIAQVYWITNDEFDGVFLFLGLEVLKWFDTPTG